MRRARIVMVLAVVVAGMILGLAGPASASVPAPLRVEGQVSLPDGSGTFAAIGPVCPAGAIETLRDQGVAGESGRHFEVLVVHRFSCADGSGTFDLLLQVHLDFVPDYSDEFTWSVLDGTGAWAQLHGYGTGFGIRTDSGVYDTYEGSVHVD